MTGESALERLYRQALETTRGFPLSVPKWDDLAPGTQAIALVNLVEALASVGFGVGEPYVAFLAGLANWTLGRDCSDWFEPTLLKIRMQLALGESCDAPAVLSLAEHAPRFTRLLPFLVTCDTIFSPQILERRILKPNQIRRLGDTALRLYEDDGHARLEDVLFYRVLLRRHPHMLPSPDTNDAQKIRSLTSRALGISARGRLRRTAFICESLGRLGDSFEELKQSTFDRLCHAAEADIFAPSKRALADHVWPRSLKCRPSLIATYNASLILRNARYMLGSESLIQLRDWARRLFESTRSAEQIPAASSATVESRRLVKSCAVREVSPDSIEQYIASPEEVRHLRKNVHIFTLLIDEDSAGLVVRLGTPEDAEPVLIPWSEMSPLGRLLLAEILDGFSDPARLSYSRLVQALFGTKSVNAFVRNNLSKIKSGLNKDLHGIIKPLLVADGRMACYTVKSFVPFCWIMPIGGSFRLRHQSP